MVDPKCENLRRICRHLMIERGYEFGANPILAEAISTPDDTISHTILSMALTGYRNGPRYIEILERLRDYLSQPSSQKVDEEAA